MNSRRFVQSFLFSRILNLTFRQTRQVYSASYFRFGFGGSGSRFSGTRMSRVRSTRRFLVTKCSFLSVVDVSRLLTSHKGRRRQRREARSTEPRKLKSPETITVNGLFGKNYLRLNYVSGSGDRIYHPLFPLLESEFLEDCSNVIELWLYFVKINSICMIAKTTNKPERNCWGFNYLRFIQMR